MESEKVVNKPDLKNKNPATTAGFVVFYHLFSFQLVNAITWLI